MDDMLTQEYINQLCSVIVDEVCEVSVKEAETGFHRKDTLEATIRALLGEEDVDTRENDGMPVIDFTYEPEHSEIADCPTCGREFNVYEAYSGNEKCPHCGQKFNIELWIS